MCAGRFNIDLNRVLDVILEAFEFSRNNHFLQVEKNILTNTFEQIVLAFFIILALTVHLEDSKMKLVPIYILSFITGRVLFISGYKIGPKFRSCAWYVDEYRKYLPDARSDRIHFYSCGLLAASTGKDEL